ncbi:hypothetical protein, partial [Heyndrickxia coagulans]|uniref:hypothetical protein n=1 Tax=Heyndrickxia coagulans TaxID=1398 RepID=UPI0028526C5F
SDDKDTKFNGGVVLNSQNTQVRTSLIPTESLDPQIALVIDTMKVGQLSSPQLYTDQSGKKSYRIYLLKSVTDAHRANLDQDFPKLKSAAQQDKLNNAVSEWFTKKRKQTFIKIDPEYKSCPILKDWATPSITQAKL